MEITDLVRKVPSQVPLDWLRWLIRDDLPIKEYSTNGSFPG